jgi:hypothetical protein
MERLIMQFSPFFCQSIFFKSTYSPQKIIIIIIIIIIAVLYHARHGRLNVLRESEETSRAIYSQSAWDLSLASCSRADIFPWGPSDLPTVQSVISSFTFHYNQKYRKI